MYRVRKFAELGAANEPRLCFFGGPELGLGAEPQREMDEGRVFKNVVFKNFKERGEWVELRFMTKAVEQGFRVSKPWGDSSAYDVGVEDGRGVLRVQVKSTTCRVGNGYLCRMRPNPETSPYTKDQVDFFAAYVIPEDAWYLIPVGVVIERRGDMILCPVSQTKICRFKYEHYREAWALLRPPSGNSRPSGTRMEHPQKSKARMVKRH
jgi:PD-(D/E)XK endonuclease